MTVVFKSRARVLKTSAGWEVILSGGSRARGFRSHESALKYARESVARARAYWMLVKRGDQ